MLLAPISSWYLPAGQGEQAEAATAGWKVPAGQLAHADDPAIAMVPIGQLSHTLASVAPTTVEKRPAMHAVHPAASVPAA